MVDPMTPTLIQSGRHLSLNWRAFFFHLTFFPLASPMELRSSALLNEDIRRSGMEGFLSSPISLSARTKGALEERAWSSPCFSRFRRSTICMTPPRRRRRVVIVVALALRAAVGMSGWHCPSNGAVTEEERRRLAVESTLGMLAGVTEGGVGIGI